MKYGPRGLGRILLRGAYVHVVTATYGAARVAVTRCGIPVPLGSDRLSYQGRRSEVDCPDCNGVPNPLARPLLREQKGTTR